MSEDLAIVVAAISKYLELPAEIYYEAPRQNQRQKQETTSQAKQIWKWSFGIPLSEGLNTTGLPRLGGVATPYGIPLGTSKTKGSLWRKINSY